MDAQHGVAAIRRVLWAGDRETITSHLHGPKVVAAGEALFEVLFGVKATEGLAFVRTLFREDTDVPTRHPVRVRIMTEAEELLSLPWGIMAWRRHFLRDSGWTFEVTDERDAKERAAAQAADQPLAHPPAGLARGRRPPIP